MTVEEVLVEYDVVVRLCLGEASQTRGGNLSQRAAVDFVPHAADVDAHAVTCCSSRRHDDANTATKSRSPLSPVTVSYPHHCRCCIRRSVVSDCGLFVATSTFNKYISATGLGTSHWLGHLQKHSGVVHRTSSSVSSSLAHAFFSSMDISLGQLSLRRSKSVTLAKTSSEAVWRVCQTTTTASTWSETSTAADVEYAAAVDVIRTVGHSSIDIWYCAPAEHA